MDDMVEIMEIADEILSSGRGGDYEVTIVYRRSLELPTSLSVEQGRGAKTETQTFRGVRLDEISGLAPISDGWLIDSLSAKKFR
jgi:hypothetical protein